MRIRTLIAAVVLAGAATLPSAGVALAQDRDCPDFASQQDAQAALDADPADRELLDTDDDYIACEEHFGIGAGDGGDDENGDGEVGEVGGVSGAAGSADRDDGAAPTGGVETGAGGTADEPGAGAPLALIGASALVAGGALVAARRAGRPRG